MRQVLVTIQYEVEAAKREAYLEHAREMREHADEVLGLDYRIYEDEDRPGSFTEVFACASTAEYDELEEKQDATFRGFVAKLDSYTDLSRVRWAVLRSAT